MAKCGFALVAMCFLLVGCAQSYILSDDRAALWSAAKTAIIENGYDITRSDEPKGLMVGTKTMRTDEKVSESEHLTLTIDIQNGQFRAVVLVRRTGPPVNYAASDIGIRGQRRRTGTGRTTTEYGTAALRDFDEEKAVLNRMRELLKPPAEEAPTATP